MRQLFIEIKFLILLISLFLIASPLISACSTIQGEVEMIDPKQVMSLIAERGDPTWDLVALGDSTPAGYGVGAKHSYVRVCANFIEEDFGVEVDVHNYATGRTRQITHWVEDIRSNKEMRENLQNAEVILIWLGWHNVIPSIGAGKGGHCYKRNEVDLDCFREVTDPMQNGFNELLSEIVALADPAETLIMIADIGIPGRFVTTWKENGTLDILRQNAYEVWREYIIQAASDHNVNVVHTYEAVNGPNGDQDRQEYLQSDGVHFNEEGHLLLADIHRKMWLDDSNQ
jgi:lysophospholipase L1-like esterase